MKGLNGVISIWCLALASGQKPKDIADTAAQIMDGLDTNRDGRISYYEMIEVAGEEHAAGFRDADVDKDMHLSKKEFQTMLSSANNAQTDQLVENSEAEVAQSIMDGLDLDRDRKLSMYELMDHVKENKHMQASFSGWQQGFKEADVNQDGHLTVKELTSLLKNLDRGDQQQLVEESEDEIAVSVLEGFDSDRNGHISMRELLNHVGDSKDLHAAFKGWEQGFMEADVNRDGQLSLKELSSLLQRVSRKDQQQLVEESEDEVAASVMDGFDLDRDGQISRQELLAHVGDDKELHAAFQGWQQGFTEADVNKDGQLSVKELSSLLQRVSRKDQQQLVAESEDEVAASVMDGFDSNRNGKLSMRELLDHVGDNKELNAAFEGWQQGFREADVDKDGQLSIKELSALLQRVSRKDQHELVDHSEMEIASSVMDGFDTDKNGQISLQELLDHTHADKNEVSAAFKGWQQGFVEADTDKNGQLNLKELASLLHRVSRKEQHKLVEESEVGVAETVMDGFDADRNGKISLQELLDHVGDSKEVNAAFAGWKQGFLEADADKDGQLSVEELSSLLQRVSRKDQNDMVEQSEGDVADRIMNGFDTNNDGKISVMELMDRIEGNEALETSFKGWREGFKEADVDQDMHLTKGELASLLQRVSRKRQHALVEESEETMAASILAGLDIDEDGKLSLQELMARVGNKKELEAAFAGWQQGFSDADFDKDGHLTVKELASLLKRVSTKDQGKLIENVPATTATLLGNFDIDKDGKLSMAELMKHKMASASGSNWKEGFKQADADRDGSLNAAELTKLFDYINNAHTRRDEM